MISVTTDYLPRSGNVKFIGIVFGTPTSSSSKFGSPVMTIHAERLAPELGRLRVA